MRTNTPLFSADETPSTDEQEMGARRLHWLRRELYLLSQHTYSTNIPWVARRKLAAEVRYWCGYYGIPIPQYLEGLHRHVVAEPDPGAPDGFRYTYNDPWDSPHPMFPDAGYDYKSMVYQHGPYQLSPVGLEGYDSEDDDEDEAPEGANAPAQPTWLQQQDEADTTLKTAAQLDEVARWERKSLKALRGGKRAQVAFATDVLPQRLQDQVRLGLAEATSPKVVKSVFADIRKMS